MQKQWKYIGVDESGEFRDIYVAVFSSLDSDTMIHNNREYTRNFREEILLQELAGRDYSFLQLDREERKLVKLLPGVILASLIKGEDIAQDINIYLDGFLKPYKKIYAKEVISEATGLVKDRIEINTGKDLDRRVKIVNLADKLAYFLFKNPGKIFEGSERRKKLYIPLSKIK